jgi:predicted enzyme related to lactoylglutathione lyase
VATSSQLVTRDIDAACAFYGDTLGLSCSVYVREGNYAECKMGKLTISITDGEKMGHRGPRPDSHSRAACPRRRGGARATLEERGVHIQGDILETGLCPMGFFADPDGNALMRYHRYAPRVPEA